MISTERVQLYGSKCQDVYVWLKNYQIFPMHCYGSTEIVEIFLCCLVSAVPYITAAYVLFSKKRSLDFSTDTIYQKVFCFLQSLFFQKLQENGFFCQADFLVYRQNSIKAKYWLCKTCCDTHQKTPPGVLYLFVDNWPTASFRKSFYQKTHSATVTS